MTKKKEELYCYLRVSSRVQKEEGHSIENQRFLGKRLSKELGMKYVELNEGDQTTMIRSEEQLLKSPRPKIEELKQGIRIGRIKNVWYLNRSRYCRDDLEEGMLTKFYYRKYQVKIYEGERGRLRKFDTPQDRFMDRQFSLIQEFDRDQRRDLSISGKKHLSITQGQNGVFMGGTINFGFTNVDKKWVINKEESKWVNKIYDMYLSGKTLLEIKTLLDTNNVKPRRSKFWSIGTLNTILKNRVYIGEYNWVDKDSKEEFQIVIPQIISFTKFNKVSKKIDINTKNKGNNLRQYDSLLSDFMTCYCGENITGNVKKTRGHYQYVCNSKRNKSRGKKVNDCENRRTMNMEKTDKFVVDKIKQVMKDSVTLKERFKEDILKYKGDRQEEVEGEIKILEKDIKLIDKDLDQVVKSISINEINHMTKKQDTPVYKEVKKGLDEERERLNSLKEGLVKQIHELDNQSDWIDWISKYGKDVSEKMSNVDTKMLEGILKDIVVYPTFSKNRDKEIKQVGHMMKIKLKLPIVNDKLEYLDPKKKSKGYTIKKGKTTMEDTLEISQGGRPKKQ